MLVHNYCIWSSFLTNIASDLWNTGFSIVDRPDSLCTWNDQTELAPKFHYKSFIQPSGLNGKYQFRKLISHQMFQWFDIARAYRRISFCIDCLLKQSISASSLGGFWKVRFFTKLLSHLIEFGYISRTRESKQTPLPFSVQNSYYKIFFFLLHKTYAFLPWISILTSYTILTSFVMLFCFSPD